MKKFDFTVMINGYKFLLKFTPAGMSAPHEPWYFPYYGHYYGCMGMHLLGQEYEDVKEFRTNTSRYIAETHKELLAWQQDDGGWPDRGCRLPSGHWRYWPGCRWRPDRCRRARCR